MNIENNTIEIDISHHGGAWDITKADPLIKHTITTTLRYVKYKNPSEASIVLGDDAFIQDLNNRYRNIDKPTNVLSFPQDDERHLGDVVFAYETIAKEAVEQNKLFEHHLTHLTIHGILHLLGFDHETDEEAAEMEALEVKILASMGLDNPYV